MRTCMYCGKELGAGEQCDCSASRARRGENYSGTNNEEPKAKESERTSYKTGYAGADNRFERARNKYRAKREAKKNNTSGDGFLSDLKHYVISALKSPVQAVINPKRLSKGGMFLISACMGAVLWLCMFFILRGGAVGPFRLLASAMSFGGTEGYTLIASTGLCILSGAVGGIVIFFLYTGIFYLINRFVLRMKTRYWDFCTRLVTAWIPFTVFCIVGAAVSWLSLSTMAALVLCGAAVAAALTYEALKTEWYSVSPSKVLAAMTLGYFVFFTIIYRLVF